MNTMLIDAIANAVLYEGYMLYPYRPSSVKNRQRFNFGVLYPQAYSEAQSGSDACSMQTECLVQGDSCSSVEIRVRFLKLVSRSMRRGIESTDSSWMPSCEAVSMPESPAIEAWQEAIQCEISVPVCNLDTLVTTPLQWKFAFPAKVETEIPQNINDVTRTQEAVEGVVEISADRADDSLFVLSVQVKNLTLLENNASPINRNKALMHSLVSAHILLGVMDGKFVSLLDPPENLREIAACCQNVGAWPVLVGTGGECDTMLASPIILYDYPQIAPESQGDLFDGTEIDEILTLRIMTMTDEEKHEMRHADERARKILERTETLPLEQLMKLHGTLRELRSLKEEMS